MPRDSVPYWLLNFGFSWLVIMQCSQSLPKSPVTVPDREPSTYTHPLVPHTVSVPPCLYELSAEQFLKDCQSMIQQLPEPGYLYLNFSQTCYLDSCGIAALKALTRQATSEKIALVAQKIHPDLIALLSKTGLDQELLIDSSQSPNAPDPRPLVTSCHPSVSNPFKRALDIVGSIVGLAITAVLYAPIAIAIKLDSPGPVLFQQTRYGHLGQPITIWKFRSMVVDAEDRKHEVTNEVEGAFFKNAEDPRITRVGRFLRRTSLDEFPQFWCVLKGDMSLVGTRPPVKDEVEAYDIQQWQRLDVKPGLTGEWQTHGRSAVESFDEVVRLDLAYQNKWSVGYDLLLIWQTIQVLFLKKANAC